MRMRKKKNLVPRMERCAAQLIRDPYGHRGHWRDLMPQARVLENENGLYYYNRMGDVIPNPELAAFRAMPNVILTDHTAFYTYEDVKSMVRGVLESAAAFAEGSPTRHEVTNR